VSQYRQSPADELASLALRLRARAPVEPNEDWAPSKLADAVQRVACDESLVRPLTEATGLSAPMVRWALRTTAESFTVETLASLRARAGIDAAEGWAPHNRMRLATLVLAGNVFTACLRPMVLALLFEAPILVRTSSRESLLAEAFARALPPPYDGACAVVSFPKDDDARWDAFLRHADATHVYGSDETLSAIRARLPIAARFVGHGHGLGVAAMSVSQVDDSPFDETAWTARQLALDVAAYDQRGCLSPQELIVLGSQDEASSIAYLVSRYLDEQEKTLPRGPLPDEVAAAARRWRDVVLATGELHEGAAHAVAFDPTGMLPLGPGHRHLIVRALPNELALGAHLASYGTHLKALGLGPGLLAGPAHALVPPGATPRVSALGAMQTPPMDAPLDGFPPSEGFLALLGTR
jgi:hypothetical protein